MAEGALPELTVDITQERLNAYCAASGDHNPLHWDARFAAETQFGGVIAHGMLTLALVSRMMAAAYGQAWLETGSLRTRFKGAAHLGSRVASRGRVTREEEKDGHRLVTCSVAVINAETDEELVSGTATVRLRLDC
ncbi:MAG: MaoC family dehydratase [Chloroflexota bacterium]|nr:MaoC family dehydratase [Chloroflexota bacterium]